MEPGSNQRYRYKALPSAGSFRLLSILDHTPDETSKLDCTIATHNVFLEGRPEYLAIFYTWGAPFYGEQYEKAYGPGSEVPITLTDVEALRVPDNDSKTTLMIQRNLYEALVRIWSGRGKHPEFVWADSICIDQKNLEERAEQVKLMGSIYAGAQYVIFWLGNEVDGLEDLQYLHGPLARAITNLSIEQHRGAMSQMYWGGVILPDLCHTITHEAFGALFWFYARCRWWTRGWIVQEMCLARTGTFICGPFEANAREVASLARYVTTGLPYKVFQPAGQEYSGLGPDEYALYASIAQPALLYSLYALRDRSWGTESQLASIYENDDDESYTFAFLHWILDHTNHQKTSDPRDSIYSLLGLVHERLQTAPLPIQPDYKRSVEEVFIEFTEICLHSLPHLHILTVCHGQEVNGRLPSWVPDYSNRSFCPTPIEHPEWWEKQFKHFNVTGKKVDARKYLLRDGNRLHLRGMLCGKVSACYTDLDFFDWGPAGQRQEEIKRGLLNTVRRLDFLLRLCCESSKAYQDGRLGHGLDEAIMLLVHQGVYMHKDRTFHREMFISYHATIFRHTYDLLADYEMAQRLRRTICARLDKIQSEHLFAMRDLAKKGAENRKNNLPIWPGGPDGNVLREKQTEEFEVRLDAGLMLRKMFATSNGLMGLCGNSVLPDDEVWLLVGAKVPFVLRPTKTESEYVLLGDCYVQGGMHGELVANGFVEEEKRLILV